jgi:alpha-galactosidase
MISPTQLLLVLTQLPSLISCKLVNASKNPPMGSRSLTPGFNTWNKYKCDIDEALIKKTANLLVSTGLSKLGYDHVNVDDCWSYKERDPKTLRLRSDPVRFPSGMKALGDYIHARGLKFGIYADSGYFTCQGYTDLM